MAFSGSDPQDLVVCSLGSNGFDGLGWSSFSLGWLFSFGSWLFGLLLLGDVLFLLTVVLFALLLAFLSLLLLISVLSILLGRSWLEVLLVVITLVVALVLIALWTWGVSIVLLVVPLLALPLWVLSNEHLWLISVEAEVLNLSLHGDWSWAQVLVWVEASEGSHLGEAGDLNERWWLRVQWAELEWAD